ncbi:epoxide hydrolase [Herbiconiux sp. KACC 21604]|uniref:epoxide hydrolase family protein n=1 Tax=unclassified Herbiconiux TaxID=2618217 RepID=UPI001492201F|nr:epoxide hydrolase family protein [Herbiconiux sp. SALV-R1]QJU55351.1 epoxide hydrolase [Herbiconiux sp. SALV-R1]WPO86521.1 epoxide hydrolase [Herbiconiux sp. KACC 21604]
MTKPSDPSAFPRVSDEALDDLQQRLERFRQVPVVSGSAFDGSELGVGPDLIARLVERWRGGFDWRAQEERLAALPWRETTEAAVPVRAIVAEVPGAPVVLLLHGWPDSVLRFERILPSLSDVTVVAPAIPGYPFAAATDGEALPPTGAADAIAAAMREFGFDRYVISAGDVGCNVGEALAARHPDAVTALHLTDVSQQHFLNGTPDDLDEEERAYVEHGMRWQAAEGAYSHEHSTRPHTLSVALGDSPAGLAAWIVEKLARWTDSDGELENAFTLDEALTWVSAYWFSGCIGTSFAPYAAVDPQNWPRVEAPTVFTVFPHDLVNAPRRFAERLFAVADWREFERGGHFAAWERPDDYLWGVRRALELARG